jgi:hypothetical protein
MNKILRISIILCITIILSSCITSENSKDYVDGEIIIYLNADIIDDKLYDFVDDYQEYDFKLDEYFLKDTYSNLGFFFFFYKKISTLKFLDLIKKDSRVELAFLNYYLYFD